MARVLARAGIKIGLEDVSGTYKAPTEVMKLESVVVPEIEFDKIEIPNFSFFGGAKDVVTLADWGQAKINLKTSLYKNIDFYKTLFAICNLTGTRNPTEERQELKSIVYKPDTHSAKTASVDIALPDRLFKIQGAKSDFKLSGKVGEKISAEFNISGAYVDRVIEAQNITDVNAGEALLIRRLGGMTLNGNSVNLSEFSFEMGNKISFSKFTNIGEFYMSDFEPKLTLKMRLEAGASDGFDEFKAGSSMSFVAEFKDSKNKPVFKLEIPKAKLSEQPKFEDSDGIFVIERTFVAVNNTGDDNFTLTYFA